MACPPTLGGVSEEPLPQRVGVWHPSAHTSFRIWDLWRSLNHVVSAKSWCLLSPEVIFFLRLRLTEPLSGPDTSTEQDAADTLVLSAVLRGARGAFDSLRGHSKADTQLLEQARGSGCLCPGRNDTRPRRATQMFVLSETCQVQPFVCFQFCTVKRVTGAF